MNQSVGFKLRILFFFAIIIAISKPAFGVSELPLLPPSAIVTHSGLDSIYCVSDTIKLVVNGYPPSPPISAFQWQICTNANLCPSDVDWTSIASSNNDSINYVFVGAGVRRFRCKLDTAGVFFEYSAILNITVEGPSLTLNTLNLDTLCFNESRIFTATFVGATAATYAWTLNSASVGTGIATYTYSGSAAAALQVVVTSTNGCGATSAILNFTPIAPPIPTVGTYTSICSNDTQTLSSASITGGPYLTYAWTSNQGGSFTNPPLASNAVFTPSAAASPTTLTLTVTSAACPNVTATAALNVIAPPTANAGANASTCLTTPYNLDATVGGAFTTVAWTATSGTFNNAALEDPVFTPNPVQAPNSLQSTLTLTVNSQFCANVTSQIVLTIHKPPVPAAGSDLTICASGTASLNGSATGNFPVDAWSWSAPNGSGSFSPPTGNVSTFDPVTNDGTVVLTFTVTSLDCPPQTDDLLLTVVPDPTVTAISNFVLCDDATGQEVIFAGTATSFSWTSFNNVGFGTSGNGNIPSYTASNEGNSPLNATVVVTPVGSVCNGPTMEFLVSVNPSPEVNAIATQTICSGSQLNIIPTSAVSESQFAWTALSTDGLILNPSTGNGPVNQTVSNDVLPNGLVTFSFTATALGCSSVSTSADVMVRALPTVTSITSSAASICAGESVSLEVNVTGLPDFNGVLSATNSSGTIVLNTTSLNNILTFNLTPNDSTTYSMQELTGSGSLACAALASGLSPFFYVEVNPRPAAAFAEDNIAICEGSDAPIELLVSAGQGPYSGLLSDGTIFTDVPSLIVLSIAVSAPGATIGIESLIDSHGCLAISADISDEIFVAVIESPSATVTTSPDVICGNEELTMTIAGDGNGTVTFTVNGGIEQTFILSNGVYDLDLGTFPTSSQVILNLTQISLPGIVPCVSVLNELDTVSIIPFPNTQNLFIDTTASPFCLGSQDLQVWVNDTTPGLTWAWMSVPPLPMAFNSSNSNVFIDIPSNLSGAVQLTATITVSNLGLQCSSDIHQQIFIHSETAPATPEIVLYPIGNTLVVLNNNSGVNFQWGQTNQTTFVATPAVGQTAQDWIIGTLNPQNLYWVAITDQITGCSTMAYYNSFGPVGMDDFELNDLSIFPNPTCDDLNIMIGLNEEIREIAVYDLSGHILFHSKYFNRQQIVLDVRNYPAGIYAIAFRDNNDVWNFRKFEVMAKR